VGESLPGWRASVRACAGSVGPEVEEVAAAERPKGAFCYYQGASFGAPSPLIEGRELKAQLAPRREDDGVWLFEI
jgi:hypothetical protein